MTVLSPPPPFPGEEPGSLPEVSWDPSAPRGQQGRPDPPSAWRPGRHGPGIPQLGRQSRGAASRRSWGPWPEGSGQGVPSSLWKWRCLNCRPQIQGRSRAGAGVLWRGSTWSCFSLCSCSQTDCLLHPSSSVSFSASLFSSFSFLPSLPPSLPPSLLPSFLPSSRPVLVGTFPVSF